MLKMRMRLTGFTIASIITMAMLRSQTTTHEGSAPVPGARIFYLDTGGSGTPVVLLHAATGSVRNWDKQIPAFTAAGFRVIAFDRRGWGRTSVDLGSQPGTAADDLLALLDQLHLDRVHLVGTAAGGFVALDFALSFPKRVRSLTIASSIAGVQDPEYVELGRRLRPPEFDKLPPEIREVGPAFRAADAAGTERWVELQKMSRPAGAMPAQPLRNHITFAMLERVEAPTLLMTGDADMYAPPPILHFFAERIRGAELLVIPGAGHSAYWEKPDVFNDAVLKFLRRH